MRLQSLNKYKSYLSIRNIKKHRSLITYLIFVLISVFLWFLTTLSKNYVTTVSYPVVFSKFPSNKILVNKLPNHLSLKVDAYGFTLIKYKISRSLAPINIDLSENTLFELSKSNSRYFLLTKYLHSEFSSQLSGNIKILDIIPDSIYFDFSPKVKRKISVKADISYSLQKQFITKDTLVFPDSVWLSGPKSVLDTVKYLTTLPYDFGELKNNVSKSLSVTGYDGCDIDENKVDVKIFVEKFTEGEYEIPIKIVNLPDSLDLKTFPDKAKIRYKAALSDFHNIRKEQFVIVADYNLANSSKEIKKQKLKLNLKRSPTYAYSIEIVPEYVDFLIEVK